MLLDLKLTFLDYSGSWDTNLRENISIDPDTARIEFLHIIPTIVILSIILISLFSMNLRVSYNDGRRYDSTPLHTEYSRLIFTIPYDKNKRGLDTKFSTNILTFFDALMTNYKEIIGGDIPTRYDYHRDDKGILRIDINPKLVNVQRRVVMDKIDDWNRRLIEAHERELLMYGRVLFDLKGNRNDNPLILNMRYLGDPLKSYEYILASEHIDGMIGGLDAGDLDSDYIPDIRELKKFLNLTKSFIARSYSVSETISHDQYQDELILS